MPLKNQVHKLKSVQRVFGLFSGKCVEPYDFKLHDDDDNLAGSNFFGSMTKYLTLSVNGGHVNSYNIPEHHGHVPTY